MNLTSIEWTTFTANPLKYRDASGKSVWGCVHHSPGCINCYSEALAKRYGRGGPFNVQTMNGLTPYLDEAELHKMLTAKAIKGVEVSGSKCFVGDMTDIFGEWVPDELLDRLFAVFALRSDVTWQVLTKRASRMREYFANGRREAVERAGESIKPSASPRHWYHVSDWNARLATWPLPNVWLGVSCEDQKRADERIPLLLQTPAAVRFISAEPLLGPLDLARLSLPNGGLVHALGGTVVFGKTDGSCFRPIDWVIVGGESGPKARECELPWIRQIVQQCAGAGTACFVKQLGANPEIAQGCGDCDPCLAGQRCYQSYNVGLTLKDRKGGDMSEWPEDLRVRQFPVTQKEAAGV